MAHLEEIAVSQVVLPEEIMRRETMTEGMDAFMEDIATRGLIQPIGVTLLPDGRFRIRWGARRTLAHRLMNKPTIAAMVHLEGEADELDDMARENYQRVQVSDGEDVRFICRYLVEKDVSASECARRLRIPYTRVLRAQAITGGDEDIVAALYEGSITAAVAEELVQLPTKMHRQNLLYHAQKSQCSAKFIRIWREQIDRDGLAIGVEQVEAVIAQQSTVNYANTLQCTCCLQFHDYAGCSVRGVCHVCWAALMELKDRAVLESAMAQEEVNGAHPDDQSEPTKHV